MQYVDVDMPAHTKHSRSCRIEVQEGILCTAVGTVKNTTICWHSSAVWTGNYSLFAYYMQNETREMSVSKVTVEMARGLYST